MSQLILDMLGIQLPIIQAPMAGAQDAELALAVCRAGGLGSLPAAMLSLDQLQNELDKLSSSGYAYNVNFFCHQPPKYDLNKEQRWRARLSPYYQELAVNLDDASAGVGREPFAKPHAELLAHYKPSVVSFHFGLPAPDLLEQVKDWGAKVVCSATCVAEAVWLQQHGVDLIIAQGLEAGGHRGMFLSDDLTTQVGIAALLPQILDAVDLPVVAAGGIATAKMVKAMLDLGAAAVQIGTSYLLCHEANTNEFHRRALLDKKSAHTAITNVFTGRPARGIVNRAIRELGPICDLAPEFPLATAALTALRAKAEALDKDDFTALWAGQNTTGCKSISAYDLTRELADFIHLD